MAPDTENTPLADAAPVRVRIAPSPTGRMHVGTARTALFNHLFARARGGTFILRIEDTDKARSEKRFETEILEGLTWLGLTWDEGPHRQSESGEAHGGAIAKLLGEDKAYQQKGSEAVFLRVEPQEVSFADAVRGRVVIASDSWGGDFVIARTPRDPVFHLAVVVDDAAQNITHVIRGEDHLTNTARHILLQRALGVPTPAYAHLPMLLDDKRRKLSKRSGEVSLLAYRDLGYLPEAMLNYLALLGWNPGDDREYFTYEELAEAFSLERVQKGGAIFSLTKLDSINQHYLRQKSAEELYHTAALYAKNILETPLIVSREALVTEQTRASTLRELIESTSFAESNWTFTSEPQLLVWRKSTAAQTISYLGQLQSALASLEEIDFTAQKLEEYLLSWIEENTLGRGDVLWPLRVALTGREHSPGPFEVAAVLGKSVTLTRLAAAEAILKNASL